ncbi:MAG: chromosomal replication initiator protein DnaA [Bacteroidetes bacterium]|uniref:Chromosomal replication initiator protein DnaA n=1 Tax=Candidatus Cryptobacteroides avistercoris TaxID=2840758 RepID=A0A9D9IX38_9BACT|nr:chromosomal replication initiator protein DnaA [Candidatus Cryptobacteroides avistercoris]
MDIKGNCTEIWNECLRIIRQIIEPAQYETWFEPIKAVAFADSRLTVEVPSDWFREYIESAYLDVLRKTLQRVIGPKAKLVYTFRSVSNQPAMRIPGQPVPTPENPAVTVMSQPTDRPSPFVYPGLPHKVKINPRLNPVYSFANLVVGECNKLGISAGENISMAPGRTPFNPLFIFGGSGLGKTHLAQAIGIAVKERFPDLVVLYVTGNEFKTQYMDAVTVLNKLTDFMAYYMRIDVLIVDDIQALLGPRCQDAFFNVFNHLHQNGKQLIFTSDRAPADLRNFEDRLLSRFKWGLSVQLTQPDYATRLAMLRSRAEREGVVIPDDVLEFIAGRVRKNFRELEGTLISLIAHSSVERGRPLMELAASITETLVGEEKSDVNMEKVQSSVCEYFNISREELVSKSRKRQIVQARQIAMYLCRNMISNCSLAAIGAEIGGKDHATVLHSCMTVSDLMATDKVFRKYVTDIENMLAPCDNH